MSVQVCVPWRDPGCLHRRRAWEWVQARWAVLHPEWPLIVGTCEGPWSTAAALNDCIRQATGDILILTGADTVIDEHDLTMAVKAEWALPAATLNKLTPQASQGVLRRSQKARLPGWLDGQRLTSMRGWGPIVAPRTLLTEVGYDERFQKWGAEDEAFYLSASMLAGEPARVGGTTHLLWHPPAVNPTYQANLDLLARYDAATTPDEMRALIGER